MGRRVCTVKPQRRNFFFPAFPSFHAMSTVRFYCVLCGAALQISSDSRHDLAKCPCCSRHVPVPRRVNLAGDCTSYQFVFPPEVLEIAVKFQCSCCGAVIRADARCEGRQVTCDDCGAKTAIPRWSNGSSWLQFSETGHFAGRPATRQSTGVRGPILTPEEIDFLRGAESRKPGAAA
jgi:DNA-directed RNA polymerase subunit RPC12/RpoP